MTTRLSDTSANGGCDALCIRRRGTCANDVLSELVYAVGVIMCEPDAVSQVQIIWF